MNNFRKVLILCTALLLIIAFEKKQIQAATIDGAIDTNGLVTGVKGATYYNVSSWKDMFDTYKNVTPTNDSNNTVYFNVISDLPGNNSVLQGTPIISNKSVNINGNNHKLYYDNDTNYTTGLNGQNRSIGFYAQGSITDQTNATIRNATWINNQSSGLFPASGPSAKLNQYYINITEYNGDPYNAASPINNEGGKIFFSGNNKFDVLYGGAINAPGTNPDTAFEWIRGGKYIEVLDGQTDVNLNALIDQMIYPNGVGTGQTIKIDDNAKMNWNSGQYYSLYYGSADTGPLNWILGKNAEFNIKDIGTASNTGRWFDSTNFTTWKIQAGTGSKLTADTAGGSINLDAFLTNVQWDFDKGSELFLNNKGKNNLFTGSPRGDSKFNFKSADQVTLSSTSSPVFSNSSKVPINFYDEGLRLHASSQVVNTNDTVDDRTDYSGNDIWERVATGTIPSDFNTSNMRPNYTNDTLNYLKTAKYIRWYHPDGLLANNSDTNRVYNIDLNNLPKTGALSELIPGNSGMQLNITDDRGSTPNFSVQLTEVSNNTPTMTKYFWKNTEEPKSIQELGSIPIQIALINDDNNLPSNVSMTMAGGNYQFNYKTTEGLLVKANNKLKLQSNKNNATFLYSIINGV
ncbi:hypothetical protein [Latilactobacillus fragifolii]|uniref:hypothetical protein n=1 Tax=Latilactobacillus fragifolii TaxID=2814244 RepID=UPI001ABB421D|nr:hypothetical protein [Latilactobacillus fragifolii]